MKLLIVRHAESEGNATGNYSSAQADSLSVHGEKQALRLADSLGPWSFDRIIASPLQRALQTVAPYLNSTQQRAEIWPEIAEACWHEEREPPAVEWRVQPASLPDTVAHHLFRYRNDRAVCPVYPESFGMGLRRVHCALERIQSADIRPDETVLMITHGHVIREFLNLILKPSKLERFPHSNCGMTLVQLHEEWTMEFCNRGLADAESSQALPGDAATERKHEHSAEELQC